MKVPLFFKSLSSLPDEELMRRVSHKGDDGAFDELYHRHARRLMGFFFRQVNRDEALAADLTQDAFMRVWSARANYSGHHFLPGSTALRTISARTGFVMLHINRCMRRRCEKYRTRSTTTALNPIWTKNLLMMHFKRNCQKYNRRIGYFFLYVLKKNSPCLRLQPSWTFQKEQ